MTTTTTTVSAPAPAFVAGEASIPQAIVDAVHACATGDYQRSVLSGRESWSGSTLTGKAKQYSGKYAASRTALEERIVGALRPLGWTARTEIVARAAGGRGRRELVLTALTGERYVW